MSTFFNKNDPDEDVWIETGDSDPHAMNKVCYESDDEPTNHYFKSNIRQLREMEPSVNIISGYEMENGSYIIYRNEKHNGGGQFSFQLPESFSRLKLHVQLKLGHEGTESVTVPMPAVEKERTLRPNVNDGIILTTRNLKERTIALTKHQTKYGIKLGILPGSDFNTYTKAKFPEFSLQVIPMMGNKYMMDEAIRSPFFVLKSKRQKRFLPETKRASNCKRRREIAMTNGLRTTAKNAEETIARLQRELQRHQIECERVKNHFMNIQKQVSGKPPTSLSIGLLFGSDLAFFAPCEERKEASF